MSRVNPYASIEKRRFESALLHLLLTDYGMMQGGRRIAQLLVEDVTTLMAEHFPDSERTGSGTLVWTCTADEGRKAEPGKRTEEYKTVTVRLPLVTTAELHERTGQIPKAKKQTAGKERDKRRAVRLLKAAAEQGGLLTIAELSVILNRGYKVTRRYLREWEEETGEMLPLKGYRMDQGSRPTHKREIVRLSAQGWEPPDIARETAHSLKSVERYLKDYERVKLLLKRNLTVSEISAMIDRGRTVVLEYVEIARHYQPDLFAQDQGNE
jgi:transposase